MTIQPPDEIDRAIIRLLQVDGRKPFTEIAAEIGVSEGTVRQRVKRLVADQMLQVVGIVDPKYMGWDAAGMVGVTVQSGLIDEVAAEIAIDAADGAPQAVRPAAILPEPSPAAADPAPTGGSGGRTTAEPAAARDALRRALERSDRRPIAWNTLGVALYQLGQPDEALAAWERAVALDPGQWDALFNLGLTAAGLGRLPLLDVGGGFPVCYRDQVPPLARYAEQIRAAVRASSS